MVNQHITSNTIPGQLIHYDAGVERHKQPQSSSNDKEKESHSKTTSNDTGNTFHHRHCITANETKSDVDNVIASQSRLPLPNEIISLIICLLYENRKRLYYDSVKSTFYEEHVNFSVYALVSRQFYAMVSPLLWQTINFDNKSISKRFLESVADMPQERLATLAYNIHDLQVDGPHWMDAQLTRLIPNMPHLQRLYMSDEIGDGKTHDISNTGQYLQSHECDYNNFTQATFSAVGQHCHQLSDLEWWIRPNQSPDWMELLLQCPLTYLNIITDVPLNENTISIIKTFDRLTDLYICDETFETNMNFFLVTPLDGGMNTTSRWWPQLTTLSLTPCIGIDDITFVGFIKSQPHLQHIELKFNTLSDMSLDAMTVWLRCLQNVEFTDSDEISPDGVQRFLLNSSPDLVWASFEDCGRIGAHHFPEATSSTGSIYFDDKAIAKMKLGAKEMEITIV